MRLKTIGETRRCCLKGRKGRVETTVEVRKRENDGKGRRERKTERSEERLGIHSG